MKSSVSWNRWIYLDIFKGENL